MPRKSGEIILNINIHLKKKEKRKNTLKFWNITCICMFLSMPIFKVTKYNGCSCLSHKICKADLVQQLDWDTCFWADNALDRRSKSYAGFEKAIQIVLPFLFSSHYPCLWSVSNSAVSVTNPGSEVNSNTSSMFLRGNVPLPTASSSVQIPLQATVSGGMETQGEAPLVRLADSAWTSSHSF